MSGKAPCNPLCRLWLLACFCLSSPAGAQYRFDVWTADDGLPQNIIRGICQTPDGYLWLATLDGLARFEGVRFTVFNKSNSPGIDSNRFSSLYEDRNSDLWLGTEGGGVTRRHNGRFTTYTTKDGVPGNTVLAITGDESGNLWISSSDAIAQWREGGRPVRGYHAAGPQNPICFVPLGEAWFLRMGSQRPALLHRRPLCHVPAAARVSGVVDLGRGTRFGTGRSGWKASMASKPASGKAAPGSSL